jgi:protein O-mannosyl-transferase
MTRSLPRFLFPLALAALVMAVYWPGLGGGYVFDDFPNIVRNEALHVTTLSWPHWLAAAFSSEAGALQRPLAMLSFAVNHYFTGLAPAPMKLTNIAIHAANALLAYGLLRQLLALAPLGEVSAMRRAWATRFAAAAWALHPINLLAVLFIVQRMESLAHSFVLAGLWLYLAGRQRQLAGDGGWWQVLAGLMGGTAAGVLAKESAALLPVYALVAELCLLGFRTIAPRPDRRLQGLYAAVLLVPGLLGAAWLLPKLLAASAWAHRDFTLAERLMTQTRVLVDYLQWTLFPSLRELSLYHDDYLVSRGLLDPPATLLSALLLAGVVALAVWLRRRRPLAAIGLAWFFAAHLLTATVFPLELVHEHRNYFASLGLCLVLADLLLLAPRNDPLRRGGALVAVLALLAFILTTHLRAREWSDPYRFAVSEAAKHPQSPRATYALGFIISHMSAGSPATPLLEEAFEALERARTVPNTGVLPAQGLLVLAARTGRPADDSWWQDIEHKFATRPIGVAELGALNALTQCAIEEGCTLAVEPMLRLFAVALARGEQPELLSTYGNYVLNVLGDTRLAMQVWNRAAELAPHQAQYQISLARLEIALGQEKAARQRIASLRASGAVGQNEMSAQQLESRIDAPGQTEAPSPVDAP